MSYKVMIVISTDHVSGPAKGVFQFLPYLVRENIEYHLYNYKFNGKVPEKFMEAAEKLGIEVSLIEQEGNNYLAMTRYLHREIREKGIDVVQTHGFKPTVLGFFLKFFYRVPWICFMHGATAENFKVAIYNTIDNVLQQFSTRTVLVSENQRKRVFRGNRREVRLIHNAVDCGAPVTYSEGENTVAEKHGIREGERLLSLFGRLSPEKGIDFFLHAFAELLTRFDNSSIRAMIVGDGQEKERLQALAQQLGIGKSVIFVGFTKYPGDYMVLTDIVVLPSRSEGLPNVVLEAMALGIPVVATAVGGVPEVIEDGKSGLIVPSEDREAMVDAMERVLKDDELHTRLCQQGRRRVEGAFSVEARLSRLFSLYGELRG